MAEKKKLECPICTTEVEEDMERCPLCAEPLNFDEIVEMISCPTCSTEVEEGTDKCPKCGEPLKAEEQVSTFECPICSNEAEEGAAECPMCGESFVEEPKYTCPICSSEVEEGAMECPLCAEPLGIEEGSTFECPICSTEVEEGAAECSMCGEFLLNSQEEKTDNIMEEPDELLDDFADMEVCKEDRPEIESFEINRTTVLPSNISTYCSFLIPLFLMIFVSFELFLSLILYPYVYPSNSLIHLTLFSYLSGYWLSALAISFLVVSLLFFLIVLSFNFRKGDNVLLNKKPLSFAFILTIFLIVSLGFHIWTTGNYSEQIFSYLLLFTLMVAGITQADIILVSESFEKVETFESVPEEDLRRTPVIEKEVEEPPEIDLEEEMEKALSRARSMIKEVRKMKIEVEPVKDLMNDALVAKREKDYEALMSTVEEIEKQTEEIKELRETMSLCEDKIVETKKDGMDPEPYIEKLDLSKEQANHGLYQDAKDTLSFLLVDILHQEPEITKKCPVCSTKIEKGMKECPSCGEPMVDEVEEDVDEDVLDSLESLLEDMD